MKTVESGGVWNYAKWILVSVALIATACGDDDGVGDTGAEDSAVDSAVASDTAPSDAGDDATDAGDEMDATSDDAGDPDAGDAAADAEADAGADATEMDSGLDLMGDPPATASFEAIDGGDFELLGDNDEFTFFTVNGRRLQIIPLRSENFDPGVDYCRVGSDAELNDLQQWARARLRAPLRTWYYDVTIETVAEEDGESAFQLVINGEVQGEFTNPVTDDTPGVGDMDGVRHTWERIPIREGDRVEVYAKAHSNLTLIEGAACRTWRDTYAWARGRWLSLQLEASAE